MYCTFQESENIKKLICLFGALAILRRCCTHIVKIFCLLNFVLLVCFSHDPAHFKCVTSVPEGLVIARQFIGAISYLGNDIGRCT